MSRIFCAAVYHDLKDVLPFGTVDEILMCDNLDESCSAVHLLFFMMYKVCIVLPFEFAEKSFMSNH